VPDEQSPPELDVMVVTDDPMVRGEVEFGLPDGTVVHFARDAREAWAQLEERTPSAVVVDLHAGSAGGFALARDMSYDARFSNIPVVILLDRSHDGWLARQAGASLYRIKPVDAVELARDLRELVTARSS
jgi:chemosensory pili system protein ChpA (sensor histidine kinase/response regulator)